MNPSQSTSLNTRGKYNAAADFSICNVKNHEVALRTSRLVTDSDPYEVPVKNTKYEIQLNSESSIVFSESKGPEKTYYSWGQGVSAEKYQSDEL